MRSSILVATAVLIAAPALGAPAKAPSAQEVMAAERAFAADGLARGIPASFTTWAAPDGIVFRPNPVNARKAYDRPSKVGPPFLRWWPNHGGIARSGDLAFDTGPWTFGSDKVDAHGWFFTLWKKQPDGSWKWLIDHGYDGADLGPGPDARTSEVPVAKAGVGSATTAFDQIRAEETAMIADLAAGKTAEAYGARLSHDAWMVGLETNPAASPEALKAAAAARPATLSEQLNGGGASKAGDLAYAWGDAHWTAADGKAKTGHFIRVWQRRGKAWKIVFDTTTAN